MRSVLTTLLETQVFTAQHARRQRSLPVFHSAPFQTSVNISASPATRKAVEDAIRQLGYRPNIAAQRLRQVRPYLSARNPQPCLAVFQELAHLIQKARRNGPPS